MNTEIIPTLDDFAVAERLIRAGYDEGRGFNDGLNNLVAGQIIASHRLASHSASAARIEKLEGALREIASVKLEDHADDCFEAYAMRGDIARSALNPEETKGGGSP